MSPVTKNRILLGVRILLGAVFLLSGIGKLIDGSDARYLVELMATEVYWLIEYSTAIVITTSVLELMLAALLFWGKKLNPTLFASALLLLSFSSVLLYFYLQGFTVESCGCFGALGGGGGLGITLIRNLVLLALVTGAFLLLAGETGDQRREAGEEPVSDL